ncbi:DUF3237 family protein [Erythrobacter sp. GH3-10]|uniref:DUF3237 family protein n=2 Tax=Aurantiacibacter rhizosphaerae TaxID=2691582 RepID=A0A844XHF7_9SPHN|nr:DUF3237 family protein [Aurantiacibacter rhizosphaerae]
MLAVAGAGSVSLLAAGARAAPADAALQNGTPPAPRPEWVYDATVELEPEVAHGTTIRGDRYRVAIIGGTFAGPGFKGGVVPGGYDWQLVRKDGFWELSADYFMETDDGVQIHVLNRGLWFSPTGGWPATYSVTTPQLEAPDGPYDWLNRYIFTGTVGPAGTEENPAVKISIFRLLNPA